MSATAASSPPPLTLLDEQLPGPLYGLPAIGVYTRGLAASPGLQAGATASCHGDPRQHFELELLSLRALWNANLPIHTLPAEVLLDIFKYYFEPYHRLMFMYTPTKRPWAPLMRVCRHWCALIRNDTEFWSTVDVSKSTSWLDIALRRSNTTPLRVVLGRGCAMDVAIPLLMQHTDRLKHLELNAPNASTLQPLLDSPLPILSSLIIGLASTPYGISAKQHSFASGAHPHLESLSLTRSSLVWTKSLLANLKSLSLQGCVLSTHPLSFSEFLDVLEHGQQLDSLHLGSFLSASLSTRTSVPRGRLIVLPNLSWLECDDRPAHIARLVSHIQTVVGCDFELSAGCNGPNDLSASYLSFLPHDGPRAAFMRSASSVNLEVSRVQSVITWDLELSGSCRLELHRTGAALSDAWLEGSLRELPAVFAPSERPVTSLIVMGKLHAVSPAAWDLVFASFPKLESIELETEEGPRSMFPAVAIRSLSAPTPSITPPGEGRTETSSVRCIALTELRILMSEDWKWGRRAFEEILMCLDTRAAGGAPRLKSLRLYPEFTAPEGQGEEWEAQRQRLRERVERFHEG